MASQSQSRALFDIPSLPESMMKLKYLQTPDIYDDPNTIENFMKETLRNTGTDAPLFEQDLPRQSNNPLSRSILNSREFGERYTHKPFHPELFLGDLTKDQRMSVNEPLVAQIAEQSKFRQKRYIEGKLQDVALTRSEGMVGNKRMLRQVKQGFNNTATRMGGIFGDSSDTSVRRTNPNPGNSTHKVGDAIQEDQVMYQNQDEKILPQYGTDIVGKLSNMIGIQWDVQPEQKFGLSSVSNIYRSKQDVDQSANAVFRLGEQDTKFKTEKGSFKNGTTVRQVDSMKAARSNAQSVAVNTKKDSIRNKFTQRMALPPAPILLVDRFVGTQSKKEQIQAKGTTYKKSPTDQNRFESLVEPIKAKSVSTTATAGSVSSLPPSDRLKISRFISRTQKMTKRSEDKTKQRFIGSNILKNAFKKRMESQMEPLKNKENKLEARYANGIPNKAVDHVSNNKMTKSKFTQAKEYMDANPTASTTLPAASVASDFKFDTDPTMNNLYESTKRGGVQRNVRLHIQHEFDNNVSPLNDTIAPYRTKY